MQNYKILLVEDDAALGYVLKEYLGMKDFEITWAQRGAEALIHLDKKSFDMAILDVMMPDMDGFELALKIQSLYPKLPFIFLTARSMKIDVLKGFAAGAVDYLKKPIDEEELVVRISALLSRLVNNKKGSVETILYKIGRYELNYLNMELRFGKEKWQLTSRENELLKFLIRHKNQLCTHKEILTHIWGENDYFNRKSLNVFISHLRRYLEKDPAIIIENVHNKGFILRE
ncbi:response regulator transcription factor [Ascidiimonas sp. W6]|uniref:response regulator transcription factor n=1 Tax=Ascidiimonas meishanensis TaxID=3128903 RepID=UPI0030EBD021